MWTRVAFQYKQRHTYSCMIQTHLHNPVPYLRGIYLNLSLVCDLPDDLSESSCLLFTLLDHLEVLEVEERWTWVWPLYIHVHFTRLTQLKHSVDWDIGKSYYMCKIESYKNFIMAVQRCYTLDVTSHAMCSCIIQCCNTATINMHVPIVIWLYCPPNRGYSLYLLECALSPSC